MEENNNKQFAFRNISKCTKDCICLYVCPFGATDTENSIIDKNKCNGCGACARACPSKAISMVPLCYPKQQEKDKDVISILNELAESKVKQENIAKNISKTTNKNGLSKLMKAFEISNRIMSEDILREAGYMLAQSSNTHKLLNELIQNPPTNDFPIEDAEFLFNNIENNENKL